MPIREMSRRKFVLTGVAGTSVLLAGCTGEAEAPDDASNNAENPTDEPQDDSTKKPKDDPTDTPTEDPSAKLTHKMNEKFVVGDGDKKMQYTVTGAQEVEGYDTEYERIEPDGVFIEVTLDYENVGKESIDLSMRTFNLVSDSGNEYEVDTDAQINMNVRDDEDVWLTNAQVNPELGKEGVKLLFDGPPEKSGWQLKVKPAGMFSSADEHHVELEI